MRRGDGGVASFNFENVALWDTIFVVAHPICDLAVLFLRLPDAYGNAALQVNSVSKSNGRAYEQSNNNDQL